MPIIQVDNLTKVFKIPHKDPGLRGAVKALFAPRYEDKVAVEGISFSVEPGEMVGYIGVNGGGKSTTIKMLTGILVPTSGTARVMGRDPHGQRTQLWWDLAFIESLSLVARIYQVPEQRYKELLDQFAETLELKDLLHVPIRNMSLGQKMRADNYMLIPRILAPLVETRIIFFFGFMIRQGQIAVELARPLDLQVRVIVEGYARLGVFMLQRTPLVLVAVLFLGLQLPSDPAQWLAFAVSLILGLTVLFMFDWMFACLAFYVTETWGLSVVRVGLGSFFSGALIPLAMMPLWVQRVAAMMPFAQALNVPVSFLSGITPASEAPRLLLIQVIWLIVLSAASRRFFNVAIRKVTVQGC